MKAITRNSTPDKVTQAMMAIERFKKNMQEISLTRVAQRPSTTNRPPGVSAVYVDLGAAVISIPKNTYLEIAEGVFDRVVTGPRDFRFDFERPFAKAISEQDFDNYHVLFCTFEKTAVFTEHFHDVEETITVLAGSYKSGDEIFHVGDVQRIPKKVVHDFTGLNLAVVLLP